MTTYYLYMETSDPKRWHVGRKKALRKPEVYIFRLVDGPEEFFQTIGWNTLPDLWEMDIYRGVPISKTEALQVIIGGQPIFKQLQEKYKDKWNEMQSVRRSTYKL